MASGRRRPRAADHRDAGGLCAGERHRRQAGEALRCAANRGGRHRRQRRAGSAFPDGGVGVCGHDRVAVSAGGGGRLHRQLRRVLHGAVVPRAPTRACARAAHGRARLRVRPGIPVRAALAGCRDDLAVRRCGVGRGTGGGHRGGLRRFSARSGRRLPRSRFPCRPAAGRWAGRRSWHERDGDGRHERSRCVRPSRWCDWRSPPMRRPCRRMPVRGRSPAREPWRRRGIVCGSGPPSSSDS